MDDAGLFSKGCSSAEAAAREAGHLEALRGPGIVPLRDADADRLLLEKAACSLADVLHERGPMGEDEVRAIGAAAAAALARVHEAGLVHGDVKPANLLLSHASELWLSDFDTAAVADERPLVRFSPRRLAPGTPSLPEADITALALTLVELSTGVLLDPCVPWRATDLRRLGCSAALSAEIALMLGGDGASDGAGIPARLGTSGSTGPNLTAESAARMLARGGIGTLPAPAAGTRRVDPTPTVEFMPVRSLPDSATPSEDTAAEQPSRWWRRLSASWRPAAPT